LLSNYYVVICANNLTPRQSQLKGGVHSQAVLIEGAHSQTSPNLKGRGWEGGWGWEEGWEGRALGMRRYSTNDVCYLVPLQLLWTLILWMCRLHGTNLRELQILGSENEI